MMVCVIRYLVCPIILVFAFFQLLCFVPPWLEDVHASDWHSMGGPRLPGKRLYGVITVGKQSDEETPLIGNDV